MGSAGFYIINRITPKEGSLDRGDTGLDLHEGSLSGTAVVLQLGWGVGFRIWDGIRRAQGVE